MRRKLVLSLVALAMAAISSAFFDDFNRADGPLGANYTSLSGSMPAIVSNQCAGTASTLGLTLLNTSAYSGAPTATIESADFSLADQSSTLAYCAIAFGSDGTTTADHGLYVKLQRQGTATGFSNIGFYTAAGTSTADVIPDNGQGAFQTLAAPINACRITLTMPTATSWIVGLDTDFNGTADVTYTGTINGNVVMGNQYGLYVYGTLGRLDNYSVNPVPEPATLAVLGLGVLAIRRRRK